MFNPKHRYPEERLRRAGEKGNPPCPICGKDWCGYNSFICSCMRISEGAFKTTFQKNGQPCYLHWLDPGITLRPQNDRLVENVQTVPLAPLEKRDRVYRDFLKLLYLHPRHQNELLSRGLSEWDIKKNGYKSIPEVERPWEICHRLMEKGIKLVGIPGFYKAPGRHGGTYWTFIRQPGYFIPIVDAGGRIQALQRHLDDTDGKGKYRLFSTDQVKYGCSSGTPAHVARPMEVKDNRIWITEGSLKAEIAAKYLKAILIGVLGVGNWIPVLDTLDELVELNTKETVETVIAYDGDVRTKKNIGSCRVSISGR